MLARRVARDRTLPICCAGHRNNAVACIDVDAAARVATLVVIDRRLADANGGLGVQVDAAAALDSLVVGDGCAVLDFDAAVGVAHVNAAAVALGVVVFDCCTLEREQAVAAMNRNTRAVAITVRVNLVS